MAGAASREGLSCGLRECGGRGWGGAGRRGGAGAGTVGDDGLHGEGILHGTEYGGRQLQYEMFYSAAQPVLNRRMFRSYDWAAATAMVDRLLSEY